MQINKLNNIVFLKDLESNIIEEAFVVLKDNVNLNQFEKYSKEINGNKTIQKEAEFLINNELEINDIKFEKYKFKKLNNKYKILKLINIVLICIILFTIFRK